MLDPIAGLSTGYFILSGCTMAGTDYEALPYIEASTACFAILGDQVDDG